MNHSRLKLLLLLLIINSKLVAQTYIQPTIEIKSPTATSFETFSKFPISLFTGAPDIRVPFHQISYEGINVPIELVYNASGNRVNTRPTWVGLGWNLNAGGVITRTIKGNSADEWVTDNDPTNLGYEYGFMYHFETLDYPNWQEKINDYSYYPGDPNPQVRKDYEPDEFVFNFSGYSGRFYLNHKGEWQVISEHKIKVEVTLVDQTQLRPQVGANIPSNASRKCKRWIHTIKLTTPDGYVYDFGGTNATEYDMNAKYIEAMPPIANAWYLTKITTPANKSVSFVYEPDKFIDAFYNNRYAMDVSSGDPPNVIDSWFDYIFPQDLGISCAASSSGGGDFSGDLIFPVYLKRIDYAHGKIEFSRSTTSQLEYNSDKSSQYLLNPIYETLAVWYRYSRKYDASSVSGLFEHYGLQIPSNFGRFKLNTIEIYNYKKDVPVSKYSFNYTENSSTRLKLNSIVREIDGGEKKLLYSFFYNSLSLPSFSSLKVDHWGFYNNTSIDFLNYNSINFDFNSAKSPNATYMMAEILEKVVHPTGGYSKFIFEPHSYSQHMKSDRSGLENDALETMAGGARIKRIETYDFATSISPSLVQEYYYKKNFYLGANLSSLPSSGILDVFPEYRTEFNGVAKDGAPFTITQVSVNSLITMGQSISGSHIGYQNVIEVYKDANNSVIGYDVHEFTHYPTDRWGNSHMDELSVKLTNHGRALYSPIVSRHHERGKILSIASYDNNNNKVKEKLFKYEKSLDGDVRFIKVEPFDICSNQTAGRQTKFASAYYMPGYDYRLKEIIDTQFDVGIPKLGTTQTFYYNSNKLLSDKVTTKSNGQTIYESFLFNTAFFKFNALSNANILNLPAQIETKVDGKITSGIVIDYGVSGTSFGKITGDYKFESLNLINSSYNPSVFPPPNYSLKNTYEYNNSGKLLSHIPNDGIVRTYLWGYQNQYPVAELKGVYFGQFSSLFNQSVLDNPLNDQSLRAELDKIKVYLSNQNNGFISYFTYASPYGISSITDTNGITTYYFFDSLGRLTTTKDFAGNVLQKVDYVTGN
jgi:hypothetical protein